jgi:hypothetical protein
MADEVIRSKIHAPLPAASGTAATDAPVDPNDPLVRAAKRAAELREHASFDPGSDEFYFNPDIIPPGWSYEWKRLTVMGATDPSYQVSLAQRGWEPVPASRHPEMMPLGDGSATIDRRGQRLMERPLVITQESVARWKQDSSDLVRGKEKQVMEAPAGRESPFEATQKEGRRPLGIKRSYTSEQLEVPKS